MMARGGASVALTSCRRNTSAAQWASLVLGGLGLRSAVRLSRSAFWASWADCLPMVFSRQRDVAIRFVVNHWVNLLRGERWRRELVLKM